MSEFGFLEAGRSQRHRILLGSALFDDVLAGYFEPATDTEHRQHTLGRLLVATLQKVLCKSPLAKNMRP